MEVTIKSVVKDKNDKIVETPNGVLCTVDIKGEEQIIVLPREQLSDMLPDDDNDDTQTSTEMNTSNEKYKIEWGQDDTRLLLRLYAKYLRNVGPTKLFKSKRLMWGKIAEDIYEQTKLKRTWIQCENRYKTILKRKATLQTFSRAKRRRMHDEEYDKTIEMVHKADAEKTDEYKTDIIDEIVTRPKRRSKYDIDPTWVSTMMHNESVSTENLSDANKKCDRTERIKEEVRVVKKDSKDVFGMFGKYVGSKLRGMYSRKNQMIAQHEIQELLFKLEMEDYEEALKKNKNDVINIRASSSHEKPIVDLQDIIED